MISGALEMVTWLDTGTQLSDGWQSIAAVQEAATASLSHVETAGFIVHEDEEVLVLGLSHDPVGDAIFGAQVIAKSAISRRERLYVRVDPRRGEP